MVAPDGLFQLLPLEKGSKKGQKRVVFGRFPCSFIVETCSKQWFLVVFGVFGPLRFWLLQTGIFSYYPSKRGLKGVCFDPPPKVVSCGFMWFHVVMSCSSMWSGGPKRWFRGFRAPAVLVAPDGLFQLLPLEKGSKRVCFDPPPRWFMWFHVVSCGFM